nr:hypothetical protein CFP56_10183 [Quercus suber]
MAESNSKEAQAALIDPFHAPEPSSETGLGSHFGNTFANTGNSTSNATTGVKSAASLNTRDPFDPATYKKAAANVSSTAAEHNDPGFQAQGSKANVTSHTRAISGGVSGSGRHGGSPKEQFPKHRTQATGGYDGSQSGNQSRTGPPPPYSGVADEARSGRRRTSSLKERYPGDASGQPLDIIRKDSRKANRSPHLNKRHLPGADLVDRLDPALGGRAYHHEGPFDAALLSRNTDPKTAPINALETSNAEALKATPRENVRDAVEHHKPLDGVAVVPPGGTDRFGRTYNYQEGADVMHERGEDEGYKRWAGETYDKDDLKGQSEPGFSLDRAMQAHKIDENGIEMEDRAALMKDYHKAEREGTLDKRDPVVIAGDESKYNDAYYANSRDNDAARMGGIGPSSSIKEGIKKRIGSLRHRKHGSQDEA